MSVWTVTMNIPSIGNLGNKNRKWPRLYLLATATLLLSAISFIGVGAIPQAQACVEDEVCVEDAAATEALAAIGEARETAEAAAAEEVARETAEEALAAVRGAAEEAAGEP
jgi:hypothetical protein